MKQSKSFGQVFLKDNNYINKIVDSLSIDDKEVLEIGPGDGRISRRIAACAKYLYCVEVDVRFCKLLNDKFKTFSNVEIIQQDITKFPFSDKFEPNRKIIVFGNVPYQISNEIVRHLVRNRAYIKCAYITFQKEFVSKLIAVPSTKAYGVLSCYAQFYAKVEKLFDIPAKAFTPVPKVDSSFMKLDFYSKSPYAVDNVDFLFRLIKAAFSNRRKKVINSLPFPKEEIIGVLLSLGLSVNARPENLGLEDYIAIAEKLPKNS
ncbi:MAG: 16S rRNA (adenine(1518)-N(6)/adenine(1519)-N(6))-dimethyltransferase RsmA [Candidatus Omnitrophota bacterium]|nr:ribosomal RNA small subunit methyltransferase A [Candidatus Omnitrophota bacterium]